MFSISMSNSLRSTSFMYSLSANSRLLLKSQLRIVKYWSTRSPSDIFFCTRTMLQKGIWVLKSGTRRREAVVWEYGDTGNGLRPYLCERNACMWRSRFIRELKKEMEGNGGTGRQTKGLGRVTRGIVEKLIRSI